MLMSLGSFLVLINFSCEVTNKEEYRIGFLREKTLSWPYIRRYIYISLIHSNTQRVKQNYAMSLRKIKKNETPPIIRNKSIRIRSRDAQSLRLLREVRTKTYRYEDIRESFSGKVSCNFSSWPNSVNVTYKLCVTVTKTLNFPYSIIISPIFNDEETEAQEIQITNRARARRAWD